MIEKIDYIEEPNERILGVCDECGGAITTAMDHFDFNGVLVCEECIDSWKDQYYVFAQEG